jgi:PKD repeat protein
LIEHVKKTDQLPDPFYKILGGYFFESDGKGGGSVQQVFGLATEAGFNLREGGSSNIGVDWTTLWNTTKGLIEGKEISANEPAQKGWTFITEPKYGHKVFPLSKDPLAIHIVCPAIRSLKPVYGKPKADEQPVSLELALDDGYVQKLACNWGDGSEKQTIPGKQQASHVYKRLEETQKFFISVSLFGYGTCESHKEVEIEIPSLNCPTIDELKLETTLEDTKLLTKATVSFKGEQPDNIFFDWGDGNNSIGNNATHEYPRPIGDGTSFQVTVQLGGPGSCQSRLSGWVEVPGICPKIESLNVEYLTQTGTSQEVKATVGMQDGIMPKRFVWDWGNEELSFSSEPTATFVYDRTGAAQNFRVTAQALGPGRCASRQSEEVNILPIPQPECAKITQLNFKVDDPANGKVKVHAEVQWEGGNPTRVDFDWGDGSRSDDVNATVATHAYPQAFGNFEAYEVTVKISGPDDCEDSLTEKVNIPATPCAKFDRLKIAETTATPTQQTVRASIVNSGPEPDNISWDWGDGSPTEKGSLTATHPYTKGNTAKDVTITAKGSGPGDCETETSLSYTIPAQKKEDPVDPVPPPVPVLCLWMPYVVAFLSALTLGSLIVMLVALNDGSITANSAVFASVGSAILLVVALIIWYRRCKPTRCDWLAIGWVSLWATLVPVFRSMDCVGESPLVPGITAFAVGAGFAFFWFRSCAPNSRSRTFLLFFAALVLAGVIAGLVVSGAALSC